MKRPMANRALETSIEYRVPYADTDQMAVVYYANYLVYFERLRNEIIRKTGLEYRQVEGEGIFFPVVEAHAEYHKSALYDDLITVAGWFSWTQGSRFRIDYEIFREKDLLTTGFTIHAAVNREGRPRRLPPVIASIAPRNPS